MKAHNYEKKELVLMLIMITILLEISTFVFLTKKKEFCYQKLSGMVVEKNLALLIVDKNNRKLLYKNKTIILEDKKLIYTIEKDKKVNNYYEILIKVKIPKKKKTNELLEFSIKEKKESILKMLGNAWR